MNRAPELARDGGRRGPEVAWTLVEGVGGRMEDVEVATAEADEGGLTGVLLLRNRIEKQRHEERIKTRGGGGGECEDDKRNFQNGNVRPTCC